MFTHAFECLNTTAGEIRFLKNELGVISKRNTFQLRTNDDLQKKIESFTNDLERFTKRMQNLDILLGNQYFSKEKSGLGFTGIVKNKKYDSFFVKEISSRHTHLTYFYCNHKGNVLRFCAYKKG